MDDHISLEGKWISTNRNIVISAVDPLRACPEVSKTMQRTAASIGRRLGAAADTPRGKKSVAYGTRPSLGFLNASSFLPQGPIVKGD